MTSGQVLSITLAEVPVEIPVEFHRPRDAKPEWLKVRAPGSENYLRLKGLMKDLKLHTVCEEARCPNIGECWHHGTATFMILGDVCTRACKYCAIAHGMPTELDLDEPRRVAESVASLQLEHVVVTSVNRDELPDGGAAIFAETITRCRELRPTCTVEVLTPEGEVFDGEARQVSRGAEEAGQSERIRVLLLLELGLVRIRRPVARVATLLIHLAGAPLNAGRVQAAGGLAVSALAFGGRVIALAALGAGQRDSYSYSSCQRSLSSCP